MEYATLNNGVKMPMAGIGTFLLTPDEAEASCVSALQNGYRLIDTANAYVNEKAVGRAMKKSGLQREEIFLETKLWPSFYEQPDAVDKTLARLDTPYIDLLLIHQPAGNYVAGYRQMEKAYKEDTIASFLICNKLDFAFDKLEYSEIYSGIDRKYWHNSILSLEDASLSYLLRFSNFPEKVREELEKNGVNTNALVLWQYPVFTFGNISCPVERNCIRICNTDKYAHIKQFFVELSICSKEVWLYNYDPVTYLGMEVDLFGTGESC